VIIDQRPYVTCICGTRITAATLFDAWQLFDRHVDQTHGRRFPMGAVRIMPGVRPHRRPIKPTRPQGGA